MSPTPANQTEVHYKILIEICTSCSKDSRIILFLPKLGYLGQRDVLLAVNESLEYDFHKTKKMLQ